MSFRYRPSLGVPYERQGLIYFTSRAYGQQTKRTRDRIDRLCETCGGAHAEALRAFVTTDAEAAAVCRRYFVSKSALYRAMRDYYRAF